MQLREVGNFSQLYLLGPVSISSLPVLVYLTWRGKYICVAEHRITIILSSGIDSTLVRHRKYSHRATIVLSQEGAKASVKDVLQHH